MRKPTGEQNTLLYCSRAIFTARKDYLHYQQHLQGKTSNMVALPQFGAESKSVFESQSLGTD